MFVENISSEENNRGCTLENNSSADNNRGHTSKNISSVENNKSGTLKYNNSIDYYSGDTLENNSSVENNCDCTLENEQGLLYAMSVSQYHWCCQYHKTISIPWVIVHTVSPCLYHESFPKKSHCPYHEYQ